MQNEPDASGPEDSTADLSAGPSQGNSLTFDQQQAQSAGISDPQVGQKYTITFEVTDTSAGVSGTILDGSAAPMTDSGNPDDMGMPPNADATNPDADEDDEGSEDDAVPPMSDLAVKPAPKGMPPKGLGKKPKQKVMSPDQLGISMTSGLS